MSPHRPLLGLSVIVTVLSLSGCAAETGAPDRVEGGGGAEATPPSGEAAGISDVKTSAPIARAGAPEAATPNESEAASGATSAHTETDAPAEARRGEPVQAESQTILCNPVLCPPLPDLTVYEDDQPVWTYSAAIGWYQASAQGFTVKNQGTGASASFAVDVLELSQSHSLTIPSLAPGASEHFEITLGCGQASTVIVNPGNVVKETNFDNNVVGIRGWCNL